MTDSSASSEERRLYLDRLRRIGQGPATIADAEALAKDKLGLTHPNLHRRIDPHQKDNPDEVSPRSYKLHIGGFLSFLTTEVHTHVEEENPVFQETDEDGNIVGEREVP